MCNLPDQIIASLLSTPRRCVSLRKRKSRCPSRCAVARRPAIVPVWWRLHGNPVARSVFSKRCDGSSNGAAFSHDRQVASCGEHAAHREAHMSKKVVLVAGVLLAVGAAAAMSAPSLRGQRHGSLLDDL